MENQSARRGGCLNSIILAAIIFAILGFFTFLRPGFSAEPPVIFVPDEPALPVSSHEVIVHVIQPGQSLEDIARIYNVRADQVVTPEQLSGGFVAPAPAVEVVVSPPPVVEIVVTPPEVVIPITGQTQETAAAGTYTVLPGDTMIKIARRINVSLETLIQANPQVARPELIYPGQVLNLPAASSFVPLPQPSTAPLPGTGGGMSYTFQPGDTFSKVAARYGLRLARLIEANPQFANPHLVYPGQVILIPGQ